MCFWAARLMRNAPRRWTPSTVSQSSSVILKSRLSRITPALLTRTAGGPSSAATLPTAASTWSAWLTSAPTANARPPAAVVPSPVPAQGGGLRVAPGDRQPVGGESARGGGPDAPGGAGHDGNPLCVLCHVVPSPFPVPRCQSLTGARGPAGRGRQLAARLRAGGSPGGAAGSA